MKASATLHFLCGKLAAGKTTESRYPQFKGKVVVDLLQLGPWLASSETRKRMDSPVVIVPVKK